MGGNIQKCYTGGICSAYGVKRNAYKTLMGKSGEKGPVGRPRRKRNDNIEIEMKGIKLDVLNLCRLLWLSTGISGDILCT
jgi:hypothetical protein